jgi:acyl transferase domain-containing protein
VTNSAHLDPPRGIAVIGMSGRFPGARDLGEFWDNLRNGVESVSRFSEEELADSCVTAETRSNPNFVNAGGVLDGIDLFDAPFFGLSPREAETLDPQQRLFLECAWNALEDAGYDPERYEGSIAVFGGGVMSSYLFNILANPKHRKLVGDFQVFTGNDKDHLTTRVSYKLNLKGPSVTVQTACSTSLVAVAMACQSLLDYQCDMALAGGVAIRVPQKAGYLHQEGMLFSRDGHCRPFDAEASGTFFSNGVGLVALKRLADAVADGDHIQAVIKGAAINNDGSLKVGYTAPSLDAQAEVIATALAMAEVSPETVTYIEAHGTATPLGDPIEIAALTKAFRAGTSKRNFCAIGSVKSNFGHLDAAAGIAGFIKAVLSLNHRSIPPSLNYNRANPVIDFAGSPFYVNTRLSEWPNGSVPRRAGVSSFGIGGTNAHVVLEESPARPGHGSLRSHHLLILSARSEKALQVATENLAADLRKNPDVNLADVAYTLQVGRKAFRHRRMVVVEDGCDTARIFEPTEPRRPLTRVKSSAEQSIVFTFPGQGAQQVNMGRDVYRAEGVFRDCVDLCSQLLYSRLGFDLIDVLYPRAESVAGAEAQMHQTEVAQPALFVIEYALAQLWMRWGVRPQTMIGHSIGEYVAACLAGVFSLEDCLRLVAERGRLVQKLPHGAMLVVPLAADALRSWLVPDLEIAAINEPSSCVLSGRIEAIDEIQSKFAAQGLECRRLHTSHAFHSGIMEPILGEFAALVASVERRRPTIPFVSNVTGTWITDDQAIDPGYWSNHLRRTVRFAEGLACLMRVPDRVLLEVGPGQMLSALALRQPQKMPEHLILPSLRRPDQTTSDAACLQNAVGRLWLRGIEIGWTSFRKDEPRYRVPLPTYPFERKRYWVHPERDYAEPSARAASQSGEATGWIRVPCWKQTAAPQVLKPSASTSSRSCWLIFEDESGLGTQVVERLAKAPDEGVIVRLGNAFQKIAQNQFVIDPGSRSDFHRLFWELKAQSRLPTEVIHLWTFSPNSEVELCLSTLDDQQHKSFYSLLFLAQELGEHCLGETVRITVVSSNIHGVTGTEYLSPQKATSLGLCRVISQEYKSFVCRNVDLLTHSVNSHTASQKGRDSLVRDLIRELGTGSRDTVVVYRGGKRWVPTLEPVILADRAEPSLRLRERGVYLITGGLGGIGLAVARYLAQTVRAKLVLLGRSAFPARGEWEQYLDSHPTSDKTARTIRELSAIEEIGGEVMPIAADVTNPLQMEEAIAKISRHFGRVHGVIHAAGIVKPLSIQAKTPETVAEVFAPKVAGTIVLDAVLKNLKLDFMLLCSSASSLFGGPGQADYSGANAFLDAYAHYRSSLDEMPVISVNWDFWKEVGMVGNDMVQNDMAQNSGTPVSAESRVDVNRWGMTTQEAIDAFSRILGAGLAQVAVTKRDWGMNTSDPSCSPPRPEVRLSKGGTGALPHEVASVSSKLRPADEVEDRIADLWQRLLGISQPGPYDDFFELGGNSLLGTQLLSLVRATFSVQLPLQSLLEVPTVAGMAARIRALR